MKLLKRLYRLVYLVECRCGRQYKVTGSPSVLKKRKHCRACRPRSQGFQHMSRADHAKYGRRGALMRWLGH